MNVKNSKLLRALAPALAISIVLASGVIATNTSAAAASMKLPTPAHLAATPVSATAISVTFDSVDHASSYTVKVSSATSEAVIGPVHKNFISGSQIDGLSANTRYRVLVMAAGNDKQYKDSDESKRVNVSTLALFISTPTYALSETHTVGSPVTATPSGNWIPASPTLHYQWNKSLDGSTNWSAVANNSVSTSYTPVTGDIGYHLKVVVTASTAGYVDAIVTSNISAAIVAPPIVTFWDPPLNQSITSNPTPRFYFSSAPGVSFRCSVDTGAATTCASPFTTPSLSDGAHLLNVYSIDSGVTGPTASYSFTVDTVAPVIANLSISAGPSYSASWIETATVGTTVSFMCQLDSATAVPCTSPYTIGTLSASGSYNFKVTGRDLAGNNGQATTTLVVAPAAPVPSGNGRIFLSGFAGFPVDWATRVFAFLTPAEMIGLSFDVSGIISGVLPADIQLGSVLTYHGGITGLPNSVISPFPSGVAIASFKSGGSILEPTCATLNAIVQAGFCTTAGIGAGWGAVVLDLSQPICTSYCVDLISIAPAPPTTYAIGATGPGGGIVFYVSPTPFTETGAPCANSCHYLEAAPTSGPNAWTEISRGWSGNGLSLIGTTSTVFGSGYSNTQTLIHQPGAASDGAAFLAQAYSGPSALNDWFLPSKDELNELYLQQINVGGWLFQTHWSSSEYDQYNAWTQLITSGLQIHGGKLITYAVRPIRAF